MKLRILLAAASLAALPAVTSAHPGGHDSPSSSSASAPSAAAPASRSTGAASTMSDAEVRKVDKDARKITLKHGEIKNLEMPPMTMVFQVKDAAVLDKVKQGDKVKFSAEKVNGAYTVTSLEPAK
jgi:Cu(I)/Ag(I) efflux system periplasmic protein CusF